MTKHQPPELTLALLHPKYWPVWIGFMFVALLTNILPYKVQYWLGRGFGRLSMHFAKDRVKVARRNLELSFPDMPASEREHIVTENFKNTGFAIFETAIAWFWPDWRLKRRVKAHHIERMLDVDKEDRGCLICAVHALNLEITARACALYSPGYGVYRPHKNPAYDYIQHWGRTRNGNIMVDRRDVKGMLKILRSGHKLFYLPDHDYGNRNVVFAPFFAVEEASTTQGTNILVSASKCAMLPVTSFREDGIYHLTIDEDISPGFPHKDPQAAAAYMNKTVEKQILSGITQWMWLHKRFKTMPDGQEKGSRYL
ncbi:MAG: LpxL/LpxP family Kdo(2)-lipid IV(A) lauroyl/palmitoleoyl acyltransferase [Vibrio sp.]